MKTRTQLFEWMQKQKVAFVASIDEEGFPNIKAMFTARIIEGNRFYFSTNTSSLRAQQFMKNPKASVYFYSEGRSGPEGLMLSGTMNVRQDAAAKESIWRDGDTIYYPLGVTDPDYCVFEFTALRGRSYSFSGVESFDMEDLL